MHGLAKVVSDGRITKEYQLVGTVRLYFINIDNVTI
jgi:hypothetical protein